MKSDVLEIVKKIMEFDEDKLYLGISLRVLKEEWPGLSDDEKKEIMAVAHAVACLDEDIDDDDTLYGVGYPEYLDFEKKRK